MTDIVAEVIGLFTGKAEHRWEGKPSSAIGKAPATEPVFISKTGLVGDEQADKTVHGGPDKAVHFYPAAHYSDWQAQFPSTINSYKPGGFGENITCRGFTEADLCIGDIISIGSASLKVTHGRQPCWKLNAHTNNEHLAAVFQKTGKTGWYMSVLVPGEVRLGDELTVTERPNPQWNLRDVILAKFNPRLDVETARELSELTDLAEVWRKSFAKKCG